MREEVRVADTNIEVVSSALIETNSGRVKAHHIDARASQLFSPADGPVTAYLDMLWDSGVRERQFTHVDDLASLRLPCDFHEGRLVINEWNTIYFLTYLAGHVSPTYRFCHGTGVVVNGRGVLLLGPSKNGKSTLARGLGDVVTDDALLINESEMRRTTKHAHLDTRKKVPGVLPGTTAMAIIENEYDRMPIEYVFILMGSERPKAVVPWTEPLDPELTVDDKLPEIVRERYLCQKPLFIDCPRYIVGTACEPERTMDLIREIVK